MPLLALIVLCAAFGGIASAAFAVVFLWVPESYATRLLPYFVSFATGALIGAALLALLPEAIEGVGVTGARDVGLVLIIGLGVFFIIEKVVLWWHDHDAGDVDASGHGVAAADHRHQEHARRASGTLVLVGDSIHNALDGVLIAAAFMTTISLGVVTTLAVAAHEVPHRVGDFAILVHAGLSRARALWLNVATGFASIGGAAAAYWGLRETLGLLPYALAFAAAGFLYIAVAGLIPGLQRRSGPGSSIFQVVLMAAGVAVIAIAEWFTQH